MTVNNVKKDLLIQMHVHVMNLKLIW